MIGSGGGTATGPGGANVVIPASALAQNTAIAVAQSSTGAPTLPTGVTTYGQIFAFTPHGTSFAAPVTMTVPFDPAQVPAGTTPVLYKTNAAQSDWEVVTGATANGSSMTASVTSFSFAVVASPPPPPPPKPVLSNLKRAWMLYGRTRNGKQDPLNASLNQVTSGVIDQNRNFGPLIYAPDQVRDPEKKYALARVYSNETGRSYSVSAVAPHSANTPSVVDPWTGSDALLYQFQYWKKTDPNARLRFVISHILVEAMTANQLDPVRCTPSGIGPTHCLQGSNAGVSMNMWASRLTNANGERIRNSALILNIGSSVSLSGWQGKWEFNLGDDSGLPPFLNKGQFTFATDVPEANHNLHTTITLKSAVPIDVPLDAVDVGDTFEVTTLVEAWANNNMQGESYYSAYFRDPVSADGISLTDAVGVEPVPPPDDLPPTDYSAQACTTGPQADAGTIQFIQATFEALEPGRAPIIVSRTGGSEGEVSVVLGTSDGSAAAGADYSTVTQLIKFPDGDESTRTIWIPILGDADPEPNETVNLSLADLRGCATLGAQSTAVMRIEDDDAAQVRYTIGGTVTGLVGTGLVLSNSSSTMNAANGPFTFPVDLANGSDYSLRIATQPTNPVQICTVSNGSGTIDGANVTDIAVSCAAPQSAGDLDPAFGNGGKVATNKLLGARALALQVDGKLVILSEQARVSRFNADGTQDSGFGTNGSVIVTFNNGSDMPRGLALQPDGKIVVAGRAYGGTFEDFGVARLNADGSLDTTFGDDGKLLIDINGSYDDAWVPLIQPDGHILVAGNGGTESPIGVDADFAVVRITSTGALDNTFGVGGKAHTNIAGRAELVSSAVMQSDGSVIIAGRVGVDGGAPPDTGLVRFKSDGTLDKAFGSDGIVRRDLSTSGHDYDEATDLALDASGRIVIAVETQNAGLYRHTLARFNGDGSTDNTFGTNGIATQSFAPGGDFARAVLVQPDGRIVTAGSTRPSTSFTDDFLVTRHNSDGTLDSSFANGGKLIVDFFGSADGAECLALQPDGKLVAAGLARNGSTNGLALLRLAL